MANDISDSGWQLNGPVGVAAKPERRRILERTARGRVDAKATGVEFRRKPVSRRTSSVKRWRA
jgi:hypothetical protein